MAWLCFNMNMSGQIETLSGTLQRARQAQRISQLELSLRLQVSQRHVSFVESGRAKPSRDLLLAWLQTLNAPLALQNAAMLQGGFAPVYSQANLDDPVLAQANLALSALLSAHDPMPAYVLDAHWNLINTNKGGHWLANTLLPWLEKQSPARESQTHTSGTPLNMLDLINHPEGFANHWSNIDEVGPALLAHLRDEASVQPSLKRRVEAFASLLAQRLPKTNVATIWPRQAAPLLTTRFNTPHGELSFFSTFTTFGTPQDITLASLRVEHLFAADEATKLVLDREVVDAINTIEKI